MTHGAELLTGLTLAVLAWLGFEALRHLRALRRVPVRVHVNGTRGKSSVTRLIVAGLRAGGRQVVGKTTGTLARVIMPNERELAVYRPLGPNVREQIRIVRLTSALQAPILVVECMALAPILQWLSERILIRATHGVITNARPDHLDVMGPTGDDVAKALCGMVPRSGILFTAERSRLHILEAAAKDRRTQLVAITEADVAALGPRDLEGFAYYEHADNVALALTVCGALGVSRDTALTGMKTAAPDPGALRFLQVDFFGRCIVFVNAFAANDSVSSRQIWELALQKYPTHKRVCLFNCRADRADRSRQLGADLHQWSPPDQVMVVGTGTVFFSRAAARSGFDVSRILALEGLDARNTFEQVVEVASSKTLVVGLGNIGGHGLDLVRLFRNRANSPSRGPASVREGSLS